MNSFFLHVCLPFVLLAPLLYCAVKIFHSIWWTPKKLESYIKSQGIRGTSHKLLLGDLKEFLKEATEAWSKPIGLNHEIVPRVDPFTLKHMQEYGKISLCWFGKTPRLTIADPGLMKEVLANKQGHFQKPPLNPLILILTRGLTTLEGEKWAKRRRLLNPVFQLEKLKGMTVEFSKCCNDMIECWEKTIAQGNCEVDVWPAMQKLTADAISRAAFGSNYEEGKKVFELQRELIKLVVEAMQTIYVPGFRFVPTKKNRRRKELDRDITSILQGLLQKRQHMMRIGQSKVDDLLGMLLKSVNESNATERESITEDIGLTIQEIVEECKQFYVAGQETTSSWLTWTMIVLAMHPEWQEKARDEVFQVCGNNTPNSETISHLKIVTMVLYEVLRLYPPVIALYLHTNKETKIGDISLPGGVDLTLPILLINHNTKLWGDDAEEFKPERFSEGILKASKIKNQPVFFPFGWGPRTCIGQHFATLEAKVALAMILQHFSFELSPSYIHAPHTVMTLQPQHGAQLTLHRL